MPTIRTALTLSAATVGLALAAAPAGAWTVGHTYDPDRLTFTAGTGELNDPSFVQFDPVTARITDEGGTPHGNSKCTAVPEHHLVQCPFAKTVIFKLGDRGDVNLTGDDVTGGIETLNIDGEAGNDTISNQKLSGQLNGGTGNDIIRPGLGADVITGGTGLDAVDYSERTKPVTINFFTVKNSPVQGEQGEGDVFGGDTVDIEVAFGGKGADTLTGNGRSEQFVPGPGQDTVTMNQGNDVADLRDGEKDTITCGLGTDTVYADAKDVVAADCENVSRTSTTPPLSGGEQPGPKPPTFDAFPVSPGAQPDPQDPDTGSGSGSGATGDGTTGGGTTGAPGQGTGSGGAPTGPADRSKPRIRLAHLSKAKIARRTGKTTLRFTISEVAALAVKVEKLAGGRRSGGTCVKPTRKLKQRRAKTCTRAVKVTTLRNAKVDGVTSIKLTTTIGKAKLGAGKYRLTLTAKDGAGNTSAPVKLGLTVAKR